MIGSAGGKLFLEANTAWPAVETWLSDGTESGTVLLGQGRGSAPVEINGTVFFTLHNADKFRGSLWKIESHSLVPQLVTGFPSEIIRASGSNFFWLHNSSELWKSDGTEAGTVRVLAADFGRAGPSLPDVNGTLYFTTYDMGQTSRASLWKTDGTESGTVRLKDFVSGYPREIVNANGLLAIAILREGRFIDLWKTDGTEPGTTKITTWSVFSYYSTLTPLNRILFFVLREPDGGGHAELWRSDGTEAGTFRLREFSSVTGLTELNGTLLFVVSEAERGAKLWKSDGTEAGTRLMSESIFDASFHISQIRFDGAVFLWDYEVEEDRMDLWRTDGTPGGTIRLKGFPGMGEYVGQCGQPKVLNVNNTLWVLVLSPNGLAKGGGRELWKSDGTEQGTVRMLADVPGPYNCSGNFFDLVNVHGALFFAADDGINGYELWKLGDPDEDRDGLPDWWEKKFFAGVANSAEDPDADGLTNWQESRAGTDPKNRNSVLRFAKAQRMGTHELDLQWQSAPNHEYVLLRSSVLSTNISDYQVIQRRILATPPMNSFVDATASSSGYFYRLTLED